MKKQFLFFLLLACQYAHAQSTDTLKVMTYNLLQYGVTACPGGGAPASVTNKNTWMKLILGLYKPDIYTVNEMKSNIGYANNIKINVLDSYNPAMKVTTFSNTVGSEIVSTLFYNSDKIGYLGYTAITGNVRDIDIYHLYHKNGTIAGDTADFWCIPTHLKAGTTAADAVERGNMAADIMAWLAAHPNIKNYMVMGDFNLYGSTEAAYTTFMNANNSMRFYDPSGQTTGWSGSNYAKYHTQSPRTSATDCGSTGGMDDRFDYILMSNALMNNGLRMKFVPNSYKAYGNDGVSYNVGLNCAGTTSVPANVCGALQQLSDHIPVVAQIVVTNKTAISPALLQPQGVQMYVLGNPAQADLNLSFQFTSPKQNEYDLNIVDMMGRDIFAQKVKAEGESLELNIPITHLSSGIYMVVLKDEMGRKLVRKMVKE